MPRVLIVQCCHLPQFFYVVEKLRQRHPDWQFEALFFKRSFLDYYLRKFPSFEQVYFCGEDLSNAGNVDRVILPLLNRGYGKIKRTALKLPSRHWEADYEGNLCEVESRRVYRSFWKRLHPSSSEFTAYLRSFPVPPLGRKILLLESCHPSFLEKIEPKLSKTIPEGSEIMKIEQGSPKVVWQRSRARDFDSAVVFLTGESGFTFLKTLPFLLGIKKILIIDENGAFFYASPRRLARFLLARILFGTGSPRSEPRILFVQTETTPYLTYAIEKLKDRRLFPRSQVTVVCREEDRQEFLSNPLVESVLSYSPGWSRENVRLWGAIKDIDADIACAIFSGRPHFKKAKLFYLLLPIRRHLAFNARLDCYDLSPRTFLRIFRKEPLLFEAEGGTGRAQAQGTHRTLLFQTEHRDVVQRAVEALRNPKVVSKARISIFCSQEDQPVFSQLPEIEATFTWDRDDFVKTARTIWKMARPRPDVVAAIFSVPSIFRKQKCLFFLLPARSRLIFNENLDCFYVSWRNLRYFLGPQAGEGIVVTVFRKILRSILFLPRFVYLLSWAGVLSARKKLGGLHSTGSGEECR